MVAHFGAVVVKGCGESSLTLEHTDTAREQYINIGSKRATQRLRVEGYSYTKRNNVILLQYR